MIKYFTKILQRVVHNPFPLLTGIFFLVYLFFVAAAPLPWQVFSNTVKDGDAGLVLNQPDEAVNYQFLSHLVRTGEFGIVEPLADISHNQVHPRSTTIVDGRLVPGGFPGIITLLSVPAWLAYHICGVSCMNAVAVGVVPLLAALAPLLLYSIFRRIFDPTIARSSALLLFILPAWWYYGSRAFQGNTAFIFFLLAGVASVLYAFDHTVQRRRTVWLLLSGILIGLALFIRPSEGLWVMSVWVYGLVKYRSSFRKADLVFWLIGVVAVGALFFVNQYVWYGHPLGTGYAVPHTDGSVATIFESPQGHAWWQGFVFPFGFHPLAIIKNVYQYTFHLFPLWTVFALLGLISLYTKKDRSKSISIYLHLSVFISLFLFLSYGSWDFVDNILGVASIGSSQTRYFLPVYILALPFVVYGIQSFCSLFKQRFVLFPGRAGLVPCSLFLVSLVVVFAPPEGLYSLQKTLSQYTQWRQEIYTLTPPDSVIVTRYADKYLFPGRKVVAGWFDTPEQMQAISDLMAAGVPVYWYDLIPKGERLSLFYDAGLNVFGTPPLAEWDGLLLQKIMVREGVEKRSEIQ